MNTKLARNVVKVLVIVLAVTAMFITAQKLWWPVPKYTVGETYRSDYCTIGTVVKVRYVWDTNNYGLRVRVPEYLVQQDGMPELLVNR